MGAMEPAPSPSPEPRTPGRRASLALGLRLGIRDSYDYLGTVVLMSLAGAMISGAGALGGHALGLALFHRLPGSMPIVLPVLTAVAGMAVVGGPLAAGFCRFARNAAARREPELFDLAWGFREALRPSALLALIQIFGSLVLAGNCWFYISQEGPVLAVLGAVFGYVLLFWLLMTLYQWPLLAEEAGGARRALRKSALLVLDNPGYSAALGLVILALTVLLWGFIIPALLLWAGAMPLLLTQATRELLRKYGLLPPDPTLDPIADETLD